MQRSRKAWPQAGLEPTGSELPKAKLALSGVLAWPGVADGKPSLSYFPLRTLTNLTDKIRCRS